MFSLPDSTKHRQEWVGMNGRKRRDTATLRKESRFWLRDDEQWQMSFDTKHVSFEHHFLEGDIDFGFA